MVSTGQDVSNAAAGEFASRLIGFEDDVDGDTGRQLTVFWDCHLKTAKMGCKFHGDEFELSKGPSIPTYSKWVGR